MHPHLRKFNLRHRQLLAALLLAPLMACTGIITGEELPDDVGTILAGATNGPAHPFIVTSFVRYIDPSGQQQTARLTEPTQRFACEPGSPWLGVAYLRSGDEELEECQLTGDHRSFTGKGGCGFYMRKTCSEDGAETLGSETGTLTVSGTSGVESDYEFQFEARSAEVGTAMGSMASGGGESEFPDFMNPPGRSPYREHAAETAQESVDPFSGRLHVQHTDIAIPGNGGMDLRVVRSYRNLQDHSGDFSKTWVGAGMGWMLHYGRLLNAPPCSAGISANHQIATTSDNPVFETSDGRSRLFVKRDGENYMVSKDMWRAQCNASGPGWQVFDPQGLRYDLSFSSGAKSWRVEKMADANGNTTTITYKRRWDGFPFIDKVTARDATGGDARTLAFTYDSSTGLRVEKICFGASKCWEYDYEQNPDSFTHFLTRVRLPDGRAWEYEYDQSWGDYDRPGKHSLVKMTYPSGGTIEYDYEFFGFHHLNPVILTTVVSERRTGGPSNTNGGTWLYDYSSGNNGDETTVLIKDGSTTVGKEVYRHFGRKELSSGTMWKLGLLKSRSSYTGTNSRTERVINVWDKKKISLEPHENIARNDNARDGDTYMPLVTRRVVEQAGDSFETNYSNFNAYGDPSRMVEEGPSGEDRITVVDYFTNESKWLVKGFAESENNEAGSIDRSFDNLTGNVRSESKWGIASDYTYFNHGQIRTHVDPDDVTTTFANYKRGIPGTESKPEGVRILTVVNDYGTIKSETNGRGHRTSYTYDSMGRVKTIDPPVGSTTTISRDNRIPLTHTVTRAGYRQVTTFDGFGRERTVTHEGIQVISRYDVLGNLVFTSLPGETRGTTMRVDILGRVLRTTLADDAYSTTNYEGAVVRSSDVRRNQTTKTYRSYGDPSERYLRAVNASEGVTVTISLNDKNLPEQVEHNGVQRKYRYDSYGNPKSLEEPERDKVEWLRTPTGKVRWMKIGGSKVVDYRYDDLMRLETMDYTSTGPADVTMRYDDNSQLTRLDNGFTRRDFVYDANNAVIEENLRVDGKTYNVEFDRNQLGFISKTTYPSGHEVQLAPNDLGRATKVGSYLSSISYFDSGMPRTLIYGTANDSHPNITQGQDPDRLWIETVRATTGSSVGLDADYNYDVVGNVRSQSGSSSLSDASYDSLNRLEGYGSSSDPEYTFSPLGHVETIETSNSFRRFRSTSNNRLTRLEVDGVVPGYREGTHSFSYDDYGNITFDGRFHYTFNSANEMTSASDDWYTYSYRYDGRGIRSQVGRSLAPGIPNNALEVPPERREKCEMDRNEMGQVAETNFGDSLYFTTRNNIAGELQGLVPAQQGTPGARTVTPECLYSDGALAGPRPDETITEVRNSSGRLLGRYQANGSPISESIYLGSRLVGRLESNSRRKLVYTDRMGSPTIEVDMDSSVWDELINFTPWGRSSTPKQDREMGSSFTGHTLDETGLIYMGARYYNPTLARFYSVDPVGPSADNVHSLNRYAYANNNPLSYLDPDGRFAFLAAIPALLQGLAVGLAYWGLVNAEDPGDAALAVTGLGALSLGKSLAKAAVPARAVGNSTWRGNPPTISSYDGTQIFSWTIKTSKEDIVVDAVMTVVDGTLHLDDTAAFGSYSGEPKKNFARKEVFRAIGALRGWGKAQGYKAIRVRGTRVGTELGGTTANPGKAVDFTIKL